MTPSEELIRARSLREQCCDDLREAWRRRDRRRKAAVHRAFLALRMAIGAEAQARRAVRMETAEASP